MWRRKKKAVRNKRPWLGKAQSVLRRVGIRVSIWLSVKTSMLSPSRLRLVFIACAALFILYNCWHIVDGVRSAHNRDTVPAVLAVIPGNRDTIMHLPVQNTALADSLEFGLYLDSLDRKNLLDSIYRTRPGLRDTIAMIKHYYHIK